jgi:energy-coupling factor transport system ATP-binding protein
VPEPAIRAESFSYRYPDRPRHSLAGIDLSVARGTFCVVCGESGSGKSTLLRAVSGLVPHFHGGDAAGELSVAGLDVRDHGTAELSSACAALLQDPETQVVMSGVRAEITLPLEHRGEPPAAVARAVEETALALGVAPLLGRRVETLSGGELQRVALAAALVTRPPVLALDEPLSQLDPVAGDELVSLLRRLNEDWGTTVLVAEHRLERLLPAADRVVCLEDGRVAFDGAPRAFLEWAVTRDDGLVPPAARLFSLAGLAPPPLSVKEARSGLAAAGLTPSAEPTDGGSEPPAAGRRSRGRLRRRTSDAQPAFALRGAWYETPEGPAVLKGVDLSLSPRERVALMGRNGAGKSTLLRLARGLIEPTRGRVDRAGEVALLMQNPGDYLVHERAVEEAGAAGLAAAGLTGREASNPRDLSGGERQRLALEVTLPADRQVAAVCLDEPTRGMDPPRKRDLVRRLEALAAGSAAVLVATHDAELAADLAERVVLLGDGVVIADGRASEVLAGGWHFATDVSRVLGGAGGALTPEQGSQLLRRELVA